MNVDSIKRCLRLGLLILSVKIIAPSFYIWCQDIPRTEPNPYYMFEYYNSYSKIDCVFGEVNVFNEDGAVDTLGFMYYDSSRDFFCGDNRNNLADSSRTTSFVARQNAVITYFLSMMVHCASFGGRVNILDTISFIPQLIDASSGAVLAYIDTIGIYPVAEFDSVRFRAIHRDTTDMYAYNVPQSLVGRNLAIRILPQFSGPDSIDYICRNDISLPWKESINSLYQRIGLRKFLEEILSDTTLHNQFLYKRKMLRDRSIENDIPLLSMHISPNPASVETSVTIGGIGKDKEGAIMVYSASGQKISELKINPGGATKINVSSLAAGLYYLVPLINDNVYVGRLLVVVK